MPARCSSKSSGGATSAPAAPESGFNKMLHEQRPLRRRRAQRLPPRLSPLILAAPPCPVVPPRPKDHDLARSIAAQKRDLARVRRLHVAAVMKSIACLGVLLAAFLSACGGTTTAEKGGSGGHGAGGGGGG